MISTRNTVSLAIAITVATNAVLAQSYARRNHREVGVEIAAVNNLASGEAAAFTVPVALRVGYATADTPWGLDVRLGYSDHRSQDAGRTVSLVGSINVNRRLGFADANPSVMGTYLTVGPEVLLTAPDLHTPGTRAFGVNAGIGRRVGLGRAGTFRPEFVIQRDFAAHGRNGLLPATTRFGFRVAISELGR